MPTASPDGIYIEANSKGVGYWVRDATGWPLAICLTLWGARRKAKRIARKRRKLYREQVS